MKQNPIHNKELEQFLADAKTSGYANKDAPYAPSTRAKSKDYHFEKGDLTYHDTYFGSRDFIGEEVVYKAGTPVWGANYYGYIIVPDVSEKDVYDFLRKALMQEYADIIPVRGPRAFQQENWRYANTPSGELERFTGREEIYRDNTLVYRADYHGGFIE